MRAPSILLTLSIAVGATLAAVAQEPPCPATTSDDPLYGTSIPGWFGTESLAVQLSSPAVWPTVEAGNLIGGRVLWRSSGFRPGMEANLQITVRDLDGTPVAGRISRATNAFIPLAQPRRPLSPGESEQPVDDAFGRPDSWVMLTGLYFREAGCWEVTATYLGQTLKFVVETVSEDPKSSDR